MFKASQKQKRALECFINSNFMELYFSGFSGKYSKCRLATAIYSAKTESENLVVSTDSSTTKAKLDSCKSMTDYQYNKRSTSNSKLNSFVVALGT